MTIVAGLFALTQLIAASIGAGHDNDEHYCWRDYWGDVLGACPPVR